MGTNDIVYGRFQIAGVRLSERNGLCDPACPEDCRWKTGRECGKYRACSKGNKLTRRVNLGKCAEQALARLSQAYEDAPGIEITV